MGLFDLFSKKPTGPYKDPGMNHIYNLLFCDDVNLYKKDSKPSGYPWDVLLAEKPDTAQLSAITADKALEGRLHMIAHNLLRENGSPTTKRDLFGIIVEMGLPGGLDVLAAFSEGTARYINYSEKLLVWETQTPESNELIGNLFNAGIDTVNQIGPWNQPRRPAPGKGMVRLTFLVSDGLGFGEGPIDVLQSDPKGGPVINAASLLLQYLTTYKNNRSIFSVQFAVNLCLHY